MPARPAAPRIVRRPHFRCLATAVTAAATVLAAATAGPAEAKDLPNIIWITLDTMRADRAGCYGYFRDTTPTLDSLAAEALVFENAFAHMATTLPSHVSLMTSTYTMRHRIRNNAVTFGDRQRKVGGIRTLPEALRDIGYATAGFVSATPLKAETGIADGFDFYTEPEKLQRDAARVTHDALRWLETAPEEPYFLWVHYFDPHDPYRAPIPFDTLFQVDEPFLEYLRDGGFSGWQQGLTHETNNQYDGEVLFMDGHIGLLLDALRARGDYDDAAVLVVGDHGEGLGQHNWRGHGRLNGETLHVPLILKLPGMTADDARRIPELTGLIDVVPTMLDALDLRLDKSYRRQMEGENVLRRGSRGYVISERVVGRPDKVGPGEQFALVTDDWSYYLATEGEEQLYDRREDPLELRNLAATRTDVVVRLRDRLLGLLDSIEPIADDPEETGPSGERLEELRALGYID